MFPSSENVNIAMVGSFFLRYAVYAPIFRHTHNIYIYIYMYIYIYIYMYIIYIMHIISDKGLLVICFIAIPRWHSDAHFWLVNEKQMQCNRHDKSIMFRHISLGKPWWISRFCAGRVTRSFQCSSMSSFHPGFSMGP